MFLVTKILENSSQGCDTKEPLFVVPDSKDGKDAIEAFFPNSKHLVSWGGGEFDFEHKNEKYEILKIDVKEIKDI